MNKNKHSRIEYEKDTVVKMIHIYCRKKHGGKNQLCNDCLQVKNYAIKRLTKCQFGENKSTCKRCTVHCYSPIMRDKIKSIMRFSGPRMLIYHPFEWIRHIL